MKKYFTLWGIVLLATIGCKKNGIAENPLPPGDPVGIPGQQQPPDQLDDSRTVLLKDVILERLPSPYFHFVYNEERFVKQISFASGFVTYDVDYENGRVKSLLNTVNGNQIIYSYTNDNVSEMKEFSGRNGQQLFTYRFTYNAANKLIEVSWISHDDQLPSDLIRKAVLAYHPDGNLLSIDNYYSNSAGQLEWSSKHEFGDYDNKTNVDDIELLKDFFDTFLFLPQVKLQKNNPAKHTITGTTNDFEITYSYEYRDTLPVKKNVTLVHVRGQNAGQTFQFVNEYTYY